MKLRAAPRPPLAVVVVAALVVALVVAVAPRLAGTRSPGTTAPPERDPRGEVLVPADADPGVGQPDLSERCGVWTAPLWRTMRLHRYVTDVGLAELQKFVDLTAEVHQGCAGKEYEQVTGTAQAWLHRSGPTYATDEPAVLSARCTEALAPVRDQLRAVGPGVGNGITPALSKALDDATAVLGTGVCTPAEAILFTAAELTPARRRAQGPPPSDDGDDPSGPQPAAPFVDEVRAVTTRATLSERCAAAVGPARDMLARAVGDSMGATSLEQLQRRVSTAAASGACTPAEITDFQAVELVPALDDTAPRAPR